MRAILLVFALSVCVQICCGRYVIERVFEYEPRLPLRDSAVSDEAQKCEDDPDYADGCSEMAANDDYCSDQEDFMRKHCNKTCKFCEGEATTQPPVLTESPKAPAPAVTDQCEDDPDYADQCPEYAAVEGYCKEQEGFMRKNCAKSCNFTCEGEATTQPPVSTESPQAPAPAEACEDDPGYADQCPEYAAVEGYCKDQEDFMRKNCAKSCNFCEGEATTRPPVSTESPQVPAPAEACEDDPDYADACPEYAAIDGYCKDQEDFMRKNCAKSCNFSCEGEATSVTVQPPAQIAECADDPDQKGTCLDMAAIDGLCQEQEEFTKEYCQLSCGWCELPTSKAPIQAICEEDLPKWSNLCPKWAEEGDCEDPKKQVFMEHYCPKSCNLPCPQTEPSPNPNTKAPSPPAFCRDRDANCDTWKSQGHCEDPDPELQLNMAIYCGVTCGICKAPTPEECFDKADNCEQLKEAGFCNSTVPTMEYEVKTNCLETCEFCVPDFP